MKIYCTNRYNDIKKYAGKDLWILCDIKEDSANPYWIHVRKIERDNNRCYCDLISDRYRNFLQKQGSEFMAYDFAISSPMWLNSSYIDIVTPVQMVTEADLFGEDIVNNENLL